MESDYQVILEHYTSGEARNMLCWFEGGKIKHASYINPTSGYSFYLITSNVVMKNNTWQHIAISRDGTTWAGWKFFVDGVSVDIENYASGPGWGSEAGGVVNQSGNLYFGYDPAGGGYHFSGNLDEFRISDVQRYTADFTPRVHKHGIALEVYSEETIVNNSTQLPSAYSMKAEAVITTSLNDTLSKTITAINLASAAHDRILLDVYASRSGTNFQLGIGETGGAFTDNLKNVAVTTAKTWETVVIDFSSVADASKNAVIYIGLKITNADADNDIYIDNIRTGFVGTATYASPVYNINAADGALDKIYWNEDLQTKGGTYANDVKFYVRTGASSSACTSAGWSAAVSTPAGSDISGTTTNDFFQFKCELIGADTTEYLYFPYLYKSGGYVVKFTFYQAASDAEDAVEFRYRTGYRNYGKIFNDKLFKKIVSVHSGSAGTFDMIAETDVEDTQSYTFSGISLSDNPNRYVTNFPSTMYGKELRLEWYKNDTNDFKLKQYAVLVEACPIF